MNLTANEWAKYYDNIIWIDDSPWELRNRLLIPVSPPNTITNIDREKIKVAILKSNALLAYWTDNWNSEQSQWWWTVCDTKNYDLENIQNSTGRRGIRKGLEACSINRIEPDKFVELAYNIYHKSLLSYNVTDSKIISYNKYNEIILKQSNYKGFELWGAFVDGKLASFATCLVIDNIASFGSTKSDPDFYKYYPNNALFYHLTKHYLSERGLSYVTNGPRTLLHTTTINDFLIKMGYRRVYSRLNIELSNNAKLLFNSGIGRAIQKLKFLENFLPNHFAKVNGFMSLVDISKTF
jgi:hypothetical protein